MEHLIGMVFPSLQNVIAPEDERFLYGDLNPANIWEVLKIFVMKRKGENTWPWISRLVVSNFLGFEVWKSCLSLLIYSISFETFSNWGILACALFLLNLQEEYKNGDGIGMMRCGHDYHLLCIKRWLAVKNACPICKAPALADGSKEEWFKLPLVHLWFIFLFKPHFLYIFMEIYDLFLNKLGFECHFFFSVFPLFPVI